MINEELETPFDPPTFCHAHEA